MIFLPQLKTAITYLLLPSHVTALTQPTRSSVNLSNLPIPKPVTAAPLSLRILPLGDSLTYGFLSSSGNGYRQPLLTLLTTSQTPAISNSNSTTTNITITSPTASTTFSTSSIQFIGSVHSGNMSNNANEGHPGLTISQIATFANTSLIQQPNLIFLMAGTNDMNEHFLPESAPSRLESLINQCFSLCPTTTIIVAQLIPSSNFTTQNNIDVFNPQVAMLVDRMAGSGKKILSVEMDNYVKVGDLQDMLHPDDAGYAAMGMGWRDGVEVAIGKGLITSPVNINGIASKRKNKKRG